MHGGPIVARRRLDPVSGNYQAIMSDGTCREVSREMADFFTYTEPMLDKVRQQTLRRLRNPFLRWLYYGI